MVGYYFLPCSWTSVKANIQQRLLHRKKKKIPQIELSLPLKKDLIEYCRTEMQFFDVELHLARLRKVYLGITGSWGGLNITQKSTQ